jgi:nucleotide-binding universal stress UspA family protein
MRWIVGVDTGGRSRGALHFARWLADATGTPWRDAVVPVHVLDVEHLRIALRVRHLDELVEMERAAGERQIAEVFPGGGAPPLRIAQALTAEDGLESARSEHGADGLVVARAASRGGHSVFRLGATARHILRRPAAPVVVVPPDLRAEDVGSGPVVVLAGLGGGPALEACRLARAIADATRRELALVRVVDPAHPPAEGSPELAPEGGGPADPLSVGERALERWAAEHEVWPDLIAVTDGEIVTATLAFAEARSAPLVVVGARVSPSLGDALATKPWRRLAALARQAVVVAPVWEPREYLALGGSRSEGAAPPGGT